MKAENDNPGGSGIGLFSDFVMALRFYSRLWSGTSAHEIPNLSRIAMALPFASLVIGFIPALIVLLGGILQVPAYFAAALAVLATILVTGAMAEDALGDAADGLAGGQTPERRLEIFKDSRLGTYGVCAIVSFLLLRTFAVGGIATQNSLAAAGLWLAAVLLARSGSLWLTLKLPPARKDGASAAAGRVTKQAFGIGLGFSVLLAFILAAPFIGILGVVAALAVAAATAWGWTVLCRKLVGAQTGDLIGALQALLEIALLGTFILIAAG